MDISTTSLSLSVPEQVSALAAGMAAGMAAGKATGMAARTAVEVAPAVMAAAAMVAAKELEAAATAAAKVGPGPMLPATSVLALAMAGCWAWHSALPSWGGAWALPSALCGMPGMAKALAEKLRCSSILAWEQLLGRLVVAAALSGELFLVCFNLLNFAVWEPAL